MGLHALSRAQEQLQTLVSRSSCTCSLLKVHAGAQDSLVNGQTGHAGLWRAHFQPRLPRASAGELPDRPQEPDQVSQVPDHQSVWQAL